MPCFSRSVLRWGLIGAIAAGGATLLLGPDLIGAGVAQVRASAGDLMDRFVDDPVALRRQLVTLGEAYPERIASVRGELAAVDRQIEQLRHDTEVAERVVQNTSADLGELRELLAEAESQASAQGVPVSIRTRGVRMDLDTARAEARRVADVRTAFEDRAAMNAHQLKFLLEQRSRLSEILGRLQSEHADFETKLAQIDRQIDTIERNERLIEMTKQQRAMLAEYEKFGKVGSLSQLESKLAELQAVQQAQLETLSKVGIDRDYEREAARQLRDERQDGAVDAPTAGTPRRALPSSVALADPIVIERR